MKYDFDFIIDRKGTDCEKYCNTLAIFGRGDILPLWIADMDFRSSQAIVTALQKRAQHGIFGYACRSKAYNQSIQNWLERRAGWYVDTDWICYSPGVVAGVAFAMLANTEMGDGVLIQPPVYHPFAELIRINERTIVNNPLRHTENGYEIDFTDFEEKIKQAKVFILCNPHNPSGRCFTEQELIQMGEICVANNVVIISDEIHSDFVYKPHHHIHIASLRPEFAERTITMIAPSKSFNIAGFTTAIALISNSEQRKKYCHQMAKIHVDNSNVGGMTALMAAYNESEDWLDQVVQYLESNIDYVLDFLANNIPIIKCHKPQSTFLLWLDFRALGLSEAEVEKFLVFKAGIGMNHGSMFGPGGDCFFRMNIGAPRATIVTAMEQLLAAAKNDGFV